MILFSIILFFVIAVSIFGHFDTKKRERWLKEKELEFEKFLYKYERTLSPDLKKQFKHNWTDFAKVLFINDITQLYHFTDISNLSSITKLKGLYSRDYCEKNNIKITNPGGNSMSYERDKKKGLSNYVRVSFTKTHPMLFVALKEARIKQSKILKISTEVIYFKTTKFCFKNAAKDNSIVFDNIEDFKKIRFGLFDREYLKLDKENKEQFQAEILIEDKIALRFISGLD